MRQDQPAEIPSFVVLDNARTEEQRQVMREIQASGQCPFCLWNLPKHHRQPILFDGKYWLLTYNQWPYEHLRVHLLAIYKYHATQLIDLPVEAFIEMREVVQLAEAKFQIDSGAVGMRFGKPFYNGASVDHLHFHIMAGDYNASDFAKVRFKVADRPRV